MKHARTHTRTHVHTHTHAHANTHTQTHTYTHSWRERDPRTPTHIHTPPVSQSVYFNILIKGKYQANPK